MPNILQISLYNLIFMIYNSYRGDFMYYTIIGDIKKSKTIKNRIEVQQQLRDILEEINRDYKDTLVKHMFITLGDEFQGMFHSFEFMFEIMHKIMFHLYPVEIRFGIGYGNILFDESKHISPYDSDGEAWWFARDAIKRVKELEEKQNILEVSNIMIASDDAPFNMLFNKISDMLFAVRKKWTTAQREMIYDIVKHYGLTDKFKQVELSKLRNESPPSINEKLKRTDYYNYVGMIEALVNYMRN